MLSCFLFVSNPCCYRLTYSRHTKDHQYVAPRLCSVDGGGFHPLFAKEILPWQIQSPLMPNVAILMSSATQGYLRDPTSEMSSETLVIRSHVLQLVNRFIRQDFSLVAHQAMRIVIHLVIIEVTRTLSRPGRNR